MLLTAILLNGCLLNPEKKSKDSKTTTTIASESGKFHLTIPAGWVQVTDYSLNDDADIQARKRLGDHYVVVLAESKEDMEHTFEEWMDAVLDSYVSLFEEVDVSDAVDVKIDGQPAKQFEIKGTMDRYKMGMLATYVDGKTHFAQVLTWTSASKYNSSVEAFKEMAASVRGLND